MKIIRICENFSIDDISKGEEIEKNQLLQKRENEEKPIKDFEKLQKSSLVKCIELQRISSSFFLDKF